MSGSNIVAIVTVVFSSLSTVYVTYATNQTARDTEKLRQEYSVAIEQLKSDQEGKRNLLNRSLDVREQYCSEAKSLYKNLVDATLKSDRGEVGERMAAISLAASLKMQSIAYLDEGVYNAYRDQVKNPEEHLSSQEKLSRGDNALIGALASQIRQCAQTTALSEQK
jgi:hypothetical protein